MNKWHNIQNFCRNERYLPDISLCTTIHPSTSLSEVLADAQIVFEAIPVVYLRAVLEQARAYTHAQQQWIVLSKGMEQKTFKLPIDMISDVLGSSIATAVCAGPSFAREVALGTPTGVVVASDQARVAQRVKELLENDFFRVFLSTDVRGVQLCAAFKNVIAIGIGDSCGSGVWR